jgi:soluble lytic murein transglycosylase-like protein
MQLMPALAAELGVTDPFDPRQNIMAGSKYLAALLAYQGGDVPLALASYNAGPGAVARYGGIPPFDETERYVKTIVGLLEPSED